MRHLSIDIETYSSVDIGKAGAYKYALSPDFEILLIAWALDGGPVQLVDLARGETPPLELIHALYDPGALKHAYNAAFEWWCLSRWLALNKDYAAPGDDWQRQWRCTMLHAMYCGYPAGLGATGEAMGLPQERRKLATGRALIRTFCVPCKPTAANGLRTRTLPRHEPERWQLFKEYCRQDVTAEREIERRLSPWPVPEDVQRQWELDLAINARGVAIDTGMAESAVACSKALTDRLVVEAKALTGLENPQSVGQLTGWLQAELGENLEDLRKDTVKDLLGRELESNAARRVLEIRQALGKTSVTKYTAMDTATCEDGRARGLLQFYGASRTGRWAGRLIQTQNLPQTHLPALPLARELVRKRDADMLQLVYGDLQDTLSQLIRTAIIPAKGKILLDADYSAIEARVIAWLAGEEWVLDVFRGHGKIYEATASQMFGIPIDKIRKGAPEYAYRQRGKVATLALGYQGASGALIAMGALRNGLSEDELPDIVARWRKANPRIVDLWYTLERAAVETIRTGRAQGVRGLVLAMEGDNATGQWFMTIRLPSGRKLYYARPALGQNKWGRESITYWGVNAGRWKQLETYGGKLAENCVQAIARDCLAEAITQLEAAGHKVVFHVHDEIIVEGDAGTAEAELLEIERIMSEPIPWAPGLPLAAAGWADRYYRKD